MRASLLALLLTVAGVVGLPAQAAAELQFKPFLGVDFGGSTSFVDSAQTAHDAHSTIGIGVVALGEVLGVEAEVARTTGFFGSGTTLVLGSSVTTLTGSLIVAVPRHWTQYTLRPYFVAGGGLMHVGIDHIFDVLPVSENLPTLNFGAGVSGYVTDKVGVSWELRRFQGISRDPVLGGISFGPEQLSFWRANMALVIRY